MIYSKKVILFFLNNITSDGKRDLPGHGIGFNENRFQLFPRFTCTIEHHTQITDFSGSDRFFGKFRNSASTGRTCPADDQRLLACVPKTKIIFNYFPFFYSPKIMSGVGHTKNRILLGIIGQSNGDGTFTRTNISRKRTPLLRIGGMTGDSQKSNYSCRQRYIVFFNHVLQNYLN